MSTITATRVDGRGKVTGSADLGIEREGETVYVKLGLIRVAVPGGQWDRMLARDVAPQAATVLACSCEWQCTEACSSGPHYPGED